MVDLSEIRYLILKTVSGLLTVTLFSASTTLITFTVLIDLMKLMEGTHNYTQKMMCTYNL